MRRRRKTKTKNSQVLIVFMKNLVLGQVKTRIGKELGDEEALVVYQQLVDYTIRMVRELNIETYIYFSEFMPENPIGNQGKTKYRVQSKGGDLGTKMYDAFQEQFQDYNQVVIIGSDCLQLTTDIIEKAFSSLDSHEAVIGPSLDGGYYLLGLSRFVEEVFLDIPWSSEQVLSRTISILENQGISFQILQPLKDIDHAADWYDQKHLLRTMKKR